jgi:hypothetical protein
MADIMANGVPAQIKYGKIDNSASGQAALVAAVTGKRIRIISMHFIAAAAVTVKFQSASTDLTGAESYSASGGLVLNENKTGHMQTAVGEAFNINLGGAVNVAGSLSYIEI